jgi:hypothetical protein
MATPNSVRPIAAEPARPDARRLNLDELAALPPGSPELDKPLPDRVTEAFLHWCDTGEGDPWAGYFG